MRGGFLEEEGGFGGDEGADGVFEVAEAGGGDAVGGGWADVEGVVALLAVVVGEEMGEEVHWGGCLGLVEVVAPVDYLGNGGCGVIDHCGGDVGAVEGEDEEVGRDGGPFAGGGGEDVVGGHAEGESFLVAVELD